MPDRDPADEGCPRDGPGRSNSGEIFDQEQSESYRRVIEAAALARAHYEIEPGLRAIYRLEGPDPNDRGIKLLEVNDQTVPTGIMPVGFAPHPASGLHYPSVIIEVTPQEYEAIQHRQLSLPAGWEVRDSYARPAGSDRADGRP